MANEVARDGNDIGFKAKTNCNSSETRALTDSTSPSLKSKHRCIAEPLRTGLASERNRRSKYVCFDINCGKSFANKWFLQTHQRIHTGIKPYLCSAEGCRKRFTQLSQLQAHSRIHKDEKPYLCNDCGRRFRQLSHIQCHKRSIHTKDRPYVCREVGCRQAFHQLSTLRDHTKRSHCL